MLRRPPRSTRVRSSAASDVYKRQGCGNGVMVAPVRHRQTKEAATDMFDLQPPRHISTLPIATKMLQCRDCPLCAMCGRLRVGKDFLHVCSIGRCSHVFGLLARHTWPLAIMPSADQVPVKSTHSTMRWHKWVVLIAGSTGSALR